MVKILVATHGNLSEALKNTALMFFATASEIETLSLNPQDNPTDLRVRLEEKIKEIYTDDGLLVFVDLFAGTPCNTTAMVMLESDEYKIECIAGVNLPILMEALASKDYMSLEELKNHVMEVSNDSIVDLKKRFGM